VPTVWLALLAYLKQNNLKFSTLKMAVVAARLPAAMIDTFREYGVECRHAWGMTE